MSAESRTDALVHGAVRLFLSGLVLAGLCSCKSEPPPVAADLLLTNARVYTVDAARPWAQSVALRDGRIVAVGDAAQTARWKGAGTRVVDLGGRLLMPAFGDSHVHPVFGGMSYSRCSLHAGNSVEDYLKIIAGCVAATPGTGTIYGVGWRDGLFPPSGIPHKELLDAISRERPLIFVNAGGHGMWVNSKALQDAGITKDTPDPAHGQIDRDPATGEPIGGLQESAMDLVQAQVPAPTAKELEDSIAWAVKDFNRLGITTWHDALVEVEDDGASPVIEAYHAVRERGQLNMHVTLALHWQPQHALEQLPVLYRAAEHARAEGLAVDTVKFLVDGVIVQKTAAMLEPYTDSKGERGLLQVPEDVLKQAVTQLDAHGMQAHFHAIGDHAVRASLDAIAAARQANGPGDRRHLISHMNVVDPADQPRFGKLGAVAVFQPLWACDEPYMRLAIQRIGPRRAQYIYPANSIRKDGGTLAYGSDWPVASANPFEGIEVALTRVAPGGHDAPLLPEQAVTLEQAVKAYTLDVAYANHLDTRTGSIVAGKQADLIVVDRDIFAVPANEISKAKVLLTLFEGKPVYGDLAALER